MPRKPRWYDALPQATVGVTCGGEPHRVVWRRGKVVLEDHDLAAERGMLAFGGELCPCMRVLEMWVEQFRMPPDLFLQLRTWLGPNADLAPVEFELHRRLGMIMSWDRAWRATFHFRVKQAKMLEAELKDKALGPLREHLNTWKPRTGARVVSGCQVALVPSTEPAQLDGTMDRVAMKAVARLHGRWVVDVWARGIATVDDAFVVGLLDVASVDDLQVLAARWEPASAGRWATVAEPAHVHRDGGGPWRLTWADEESPDMRGPAGLGPPPGARGGAAPSTWAPGARTT
jgi:hypothetical protein